MDILWALLTLPYAPVRGLTAVMKAIAREAESQQYNPVNIRRELEELDHAAEAGELTPEERDRRQAQVLERLTPEPVGETGSAQQGASESAGARPAPESAGTGGPPLRRPAPTGRRTGRRGDASSGDGGERHGTRTHSRRR